MGFSVEQFYKTMISVQVKREGDYEQDEILFCGKCHKPRREYRDIDGKRILCPIDCDCDIEKAKAEAEKQERDKKMEQIRRLKDISLMDSLFLQSNFDNFVVKKDNERIYKICYKYSTHFDEMKAQNQGLLFYGAVGTGKSFAAACIANELMDRLVPVMMTSFVVVLKHLTSNLNEQESTIQRLMQPELLILDDFGAERNTDYAVEKVYDIIDSRYRAAKPVILTTNLTLSEIKNCTDIRYSRIYDRVLEMCYPVYFEGVSKRKIEAKKRFERMTDFFEGD